MVGIMFGVRLASLFTSRWMALAWGVLVCLTAVGFVGGRDDKDAAADAQTARAVDTALNAMK